MHGLDQILVSVSYVRTVLKYTVRSQLNFIASTYYSLKHVSTDLAICR